jgi:hypothetical protein
VSLHSGHTKNRVDSGGIFFGTCIIRAGNENAIGIDCLRFGGEETGGALAISTSRREEVFKRIYSGSLI